jgi:hypothetical protein
MQELREQACPTDNHDGSGGLVAEAPSARLMTVASRPRRLADWPMLVWMCPLPLAHLPAFAHPRACGRLPSRLVCHLGCWSDCSFVVPGCAPKQSLA